MVTLGKATPILRIFDEARAREFYVHYLGFSIDWEHRFEPGTPIYMQISKDGCVIHLSEHHGDGTPGTYVRVECNGLDEYQQTLLAKKYKYARPDIQDMPWGTREMSIADPFRNQMIFWTASAA